MTSFRRKQRDGQLGAGRGCLFLIAAVCASCHFGGPASTELAFSPSPSALTSDGLIVRPDGTLRRKLQVSALCFGFDDEWTLAPPRSLRFGDEPEVAIRAKCMTRDTHYSATEFFGLRIASAYDFCARFSHIPLGAAIESCEIRADHRVVARRIVWRELNTK